MNRIHRLEELGQSVWLDFLDRELLTSGELTRMIHQDGIRGVTSNPTIFQKAIAGSSAYDDLIRAAPPGESEASILEKVMVRDLTLACDRLRPVYNATDGADGFASIEVEPTRAGDTAAQVEQAARLWAAVDRPNLMVKIPGTRPGVPAIQSCIAHGININVTLLFSVSRYREVIEAYLMGLERRVAANQPVDRVASVASFFVSRIDTKLDKHLDALPNALRGAAGALRGQIAIANAKIAYEKYEEILESDRWKALAAKGARPQRLLWASTSSKDPLYADTYYPDALVAPLTIDTMTRETLRAYLDHGNPEVRIATNREIAHRQMRDLAALQIDLTSETDALETEGIASFTDSFQSTLRAIAEKRARRRGAGAAVVFRR
jgi:transaldolase